MAEGNAEPIDLEVRDNLRAALARTALLLRLDAFPGLTDDDDTAIADALRLVGVQIVADEKNLASPNGQTALVTLVCQCAMLGLRIDLHAPDVPQVSPQPPLRAELPIVAALVAWAEELFPGALGTVDSPAITFAVGDAPTGRVEHAAVYVCGGDHRVLLTSDRAEAKCWSGAEPWAAVAAAAGAAAEAMRAAVPHVAASLGQPMPAEITWRPRAFSTVRLDLPPTRGSSEPLGNVDIISAGAITHAVLYTLLRVPGLAANLRVLDLDDLARSNSNRYSLLSATDLGRPKVEHLADLSTEAIRITAARLRFDEDTIGETEPLAPQVIVGVDDIPTRWLIQRQQPQWLGVGATSHAFVLVSDHVPGRPCAGCVHPRDDENPTEEIPTIGFVSLWAGLLLASTLLAPTESNGEGTWRIEAHPMGLDGPNGITRLMQSPNPLCPLCGA